MRSNIKRLFFISLFRLVLGRIIIFLRFKRYVLTARPIVKTISLRESILELFCHELLARIDSICRSVVLALIRPRCGWARVK